MNFQAGLYIVSTPIGNLEDITLRALTTLKNSHFILCEDTRVTSKLLAKHNIKTCLKIYNDKSDDKLRNSIKNFILEGKIISLVSDAGTPLISDPGYKLVRELRLNNLYVDVIPGACALISALALSGLPTDKFTFLGFIPKTYEKKKKLFEEYKLLNTSLVFYESSNRLVHTLEAALEILGNREANIARELTKIHQESKSAKLSTLIDYYKSHLPRGEIVLTITGNNDLGISESLLEKEISLILKEGKTAKTASDIIFAKYKNKFSRKFIYQLANKLKN